ncbi:hypothetical protein [Pseudoxanthomonas spadix]|uniref:hypothetical protein n=1 Tax=Pseudoxanthomonas spadix TaxID=415229 RepID=UPI000F0023E6|nr:hypothetical protein [Pseudoxanthomonas spadix]MBP3974327.1 hypothetical protein [Pseudoxanthomonas spadix]RMW97479.1 hypothetical protein D9R12_05155 [Pseudoxanthomonas spadix]
MQPRKTALAHAALQTHRAGLDMRQRRVLIMADGQRSLGELSQLLGPETAQQVAALIRDGYLTADAEPTLHEALATPQAAPAAPPPAPAAPASHRRSLVAARLYLLGMLELQRDPAAQRLHQQLQRTTDEYPAVEVMLEALTLLPQLTSPGYAQRVQTRLSEVLPEEHLPALARIGLALED